MSRFDYRDPGTDPAYCDGLSEPPEPEVPCLTCGWVLPASMLDEEWRCESCVSDDSIQKEEER